MKNILVLLSIALLAFAGCGKLDHCHDCVCAECPCLDGGACASEDCHCDCGHCQHDHQNPSGGCDGGVCPHP